MGRLQAFILLVSAVALGCVQRATSLPPRGPSGDPAAFTAFVSPTEAQFVFPVNVRRDWAWPGAPGAPGDTRFAWGVTVAEGGGAYLVGVSVDQTVHPEMLKDLNEAVSAATTDVAAIAPGSHFQQRVPGADVRVKAVGGRVTLTVRGGAMIAHVFAGHPARVRFGILAPTAPLWWSDSVAVTYADR